MEIQFSNKDLKWTPVINGVSVHIYADELGIVGCNLKINFTSNSVYIVSSRWNIGYRRACFF